MPSISSEQYRLEVIPRNRATSSQLQRRMSADHRKKELPSRYQPIMTLTPTPERHTTRPQHHLRKSDTPFETLHPRQEYSEFQEKCITYLTKKKTTRLEEDDPRRPNFCTMLQNIKRVIKENEKRDKQSKNIEESQGGNELTCKPSQIHQIYHPQEQKMELYKMLKNNQQKQMQRQSSKMNPTPLKYVMNPFAYHNTIVCFSMSLNQPNSKKPNSYETPPQRLGSSPGRKVQILRPVTQKTMSFQLNGDGDGQYMRKLKSFLDFLFKVNYSNNLYVSLELRPNSEDPQSRYIMYLGRGNNSLLIKSLMKRRFWWEITQNISHPDVDFYWSQNIIEKAHEKQTFCLDLLPMAQPKGRAIKGEQRYDMNRKIMPLEKCQAVERLIHKDGYTLPFEQTYTPDILTNHLPRNYCIGSKKNLYRSLLYYYTEVKKKDPFEFIPHTYHVTSVHDPEYRRFFMENRDNSNKIWIVKPGENTNRGNGIKLATFTRVPKLLGKGKHANGQPYTYILQSYLHRPLLYNGRKFDIRHYLLLTSVRGAVKAYWYKEGYLRTCSELYDLDDLDNAYIHLTNDAIQRQGENYQKYEPGNKLSYSQFQRYLDYTFPSKNYNFERTMLPRMKELALGVVKANYQTIDHRRNSNNFQIFGLDFLIDRNWKPWLIEVNYNPCLEINCPLMERIVPALVENSLRVGLDPLYPPNMHFPPNKRFHLSDHHLKNLRYELIFDQCSLKNNTPNFYDFKDEKETEEEYQDDGNELTDQVE